MAAVLWLGPSELPGGAPRERTPEGVELLRADSPAPYVHRITLYDHSGAAIDPQDPLAGPYSPRMTCGKCHPYAEISRGWHFNAADAHVPPGRPGEPWILVDPATGTQVPISGRAWPGTFRPEEAGLSAWDFVLRFGRHMPGGGYGEPPQRGTAADPNGAGLRPEAGAADQSRRAGSTLRPRWEISGALEIDCMFCHAGDQQHDPAEPARQIEKENFKWAPTAALGLAVVRGEARKAPDDWDPLAPPDPDHPERAGPQLVWDRSRFDPDGRVLLNITRRPRPERCYFCHSFREVGSWAADDLVVAQDVHLSAGMICVDCHRNGLDHRIVRGYQTEARERGRPELAIFTCEGCHLGVSTAGDAAAALGGRCGAPHPLHRGLPPLHFEKLTCTACHSGPWPQMNAKRFQTALAHGLGLATRERKADDPPQIVGPVFAPQHDGKIAPQRMVWPAFWARFELRPGSCLLPLDGVLTCLSPDELGALVAPLVAGKSRPDDEISAAVLAHLAQGDPPFVVRSADGLVSVLNAAGGLLREPYTAAQRPLSVLSDTEELAALKLALGRAAPYRWSIAHNVRPAAQSLGAGGCTDCHADDAPFYFGRVADADDTSADQRPVRYMHELRGDDARFARAYVRLVRAWNLGFVFRPAFKWFGFLAAAALALLVLRYALDGLGAIARRFR